MSKPNIVFIFTDDQRFDTINALGNNAIQTPNMDKLVAEGLSFTRAHIPCGTTGAVCMPSRGMLLSGRTLFHLQGCGEEIPPQHVTFPQLLQQHGYNAYGSGKWHNGRASFARSFNQGAEIFFGGMADHWNVPVYHFDPSGKYDRRLNEIKNPFKNNEMIQRECDHIRSGEHSTDIIMQAALNHIESYDDEKPMLMYVALLAPHDPRSMPDRFKQMYNADEIELPENFLPEHLIDTGALRNRDEQLEAFPREPQKIKQHIAEYYAMITHIDYQLGKVMQALDEKGIRDNTLIILAGDNGLAVGQHGLMGKQNHYEHSVRVPLIFSGPGVPRGVQAESYAYLLDIYPTLCDYLQIEKPDSVEGESLLPVFKDPQQHVRNELYFAYCDTIRSVKDQQFKLIEYRSEGGRASQLFDLVNDPSEMHNLIDDPAQAPRIAALRQRLLAWRADWEDGNHPHTNTYWGRYESTS